MQMVYNSDNYAVVRFDVPSDTKQTGESSPARGGYEIVDKFGRKEIYIQGEMAATFKEGVEALIKTSPSEEELDEYLGRYVALMQHPVILH